MQASQIRAEIIECCRVNGRVTTAQIRQKQDIPSYDGQQLYNQLRKMVKEGVLDRGLHFTEKGHGRNEPVYQYWLIEDPEGVN